jgi:integrase
MKDKKRQRLPRGLHWDPKSQYISFNWRDSRGKQHGQSTHTTDPARALIFKLDFLKKQRASLDQIENATENLSTLNLRQVSEMYFNWKRASNSANTISREQKMFKSVLRFFGSQTVVRSISLAKIRQYQQERRSHISAHLKQQVTGRTVNYEAQLLRGVMTYAGCWTSDLATQYKPLRQVKSRAGKVATKEQLMNIIAAAKTNPYWELAMYAAAVAIGTGCRSCEIKNLRLQDIHLEAGKIVVRAEIAKNRREREPRLMALAQWGLRYLLNRATALGAGKPEHYLLPLNLSKSRRLSKATEQKWNLHQPMVSWVKSWRKLVEKCGMKGFRFHDLRHTFRTLGAEAGVPLEVMMAQLGHMDRETSLQYVHIQQRALERARQLIESEQAEILAFAQGDAP